MGSLAAQFEKKFGGNMEATAGRVVQVQGGVVDVEFPEGGLPEIYHAIVISRDEGDLVLEVQKHLGNNWVRCVGMDSTDGLQRGGYVLRDPADVSPLSSPSLILAKVIVPV